MGCRVSLTQWKMAVGETITSSVEKGQIKSPKSLSEAFYFFGESLER